MKIKVLGVGSAFSTEQFNSMYLLEADNGHKMAIDLGSDAKWAYKFARIDIGDIEAVYISHEHGDHAQGLEWLGFNTYFNPSLPRPALYLVDVIKDSLWNRGLSAAMGSVQGKVCGLDDFFDVKPIKLNDSVDWNGIHVQPVQTVHIMNGFGLVPTFGLLLTEHGKTVFITTDTQHAPKQIMDFYYKSDLIIQDCETIYMPDGTPIKSGVHAHYEDLKELPDHVRGKMLLTHYQMGTDTSTAKEDGFLKFLQTHDEITVSERKGIEFTKTETRTRIKMLAESF